jgi:hypothetical protein
MAKAALFISGLFFGGVIDHVILGIQGSPLTPYGLRLGAGGNWVLAALDLAVAGMLYVVSKRFEGQAVKAG